mmetsp:Transcript_111737/g.256164  ORF Transcript_111737/g.256164 Transcript_111737/m.256164 type:complete len:858 (+) Transcript_111737:69-2642(+)
MRTAVGVVAAILGVTPSVAQDVDLLTQRVNALIEARTSCLEKSSNSVQLIADYNTLQGYKSDKCADLESDVLAQYAVSVDDLNNTQANQATAKVDDAVQWVKDQRSENLLLKLVEENMLVSLCEKFETQENCTAVTYDLMEGDTQCTWNGACSHVKRYKEEDYLASLAVFVAPFGVGLFMLLVWLCTCPLVCCKCWRRCCNKADGNSRMPGPCVPLCPCNESNNNKSWGATTNMVFCVFFVIFSLLTFVFAIMAYGGASDFDSGYDNFACAGFTFLDNMRFGVPPATSGEFDATSTDSQLWLGTSCVVVTLNNVVEQFNPAYANVANPNGENTLVYKLTNPTDGLLAPGSPTSDFIALLGRLGTRLEQFSGFLEANLRITSDVGNFNCAEELSDEDNCENLVSQITKASDDFQASDAANMRSLVSDQIEGTIVNESTKLYTDLRPLADSLQDMEDQFGDMIDSMAENEQVTDNKGIAVLATLLFAFVTVIPVLLGLLGSLYNGFNFRAGEGTKRCAFMPLGSWCTFCFYMSWGLIVGGLILPILIPFGEFCDVLGNDIMTYDGFDKWSKLMGAGEAEAKNAREFGRQCLLPRDEEGLQGTGQLFKAMDMEDIPKMLVDARQEFSSGKDKFTTGDTASLEFDMGTINDLKCEAPTGGERVEETCPLSNVYCMNGETSGNDPNTCAIVGDVSDLYANSLASYYAPLGVFTQANFDRPLFQCYDGDINLVAPAAGATMVGCTISEYIVQLKAFATALNDFGPATDTALQAVIDDIYGANSLVYQALDELTTDAQFVILGLECSWMAESWAATESAVCGDMAGGAYNMAIFWIVTAVMACFSALLQYKLWRKTQAKNAAQQ